MMIYRCENQNYKDYRIYGGKGIKVCNEWKNDPKKFAEWAINNGYKLGLTIERIDSDKDYCPENCKFIPMSEQPKNTSRNVFVEYKGGTYIISDVARMENVSCEAIRKRLRHGAYKRVVNPKLG